MGGRHWRRARMAPAAGCPSAVLRPELGAQGAAWTSRLDRSWWIPAYLTTFAADEHAVHVVLDVRDVQVT